MNSCQSPGERRGKKKKFTPMLFVAWLTFSCLAWLDLKGPPKVLPSQKKFFILCCDTSALAAVHFPARIRLRVVIQILHSVEQSLLPRSYFCFLGSIFPFLLYEILLPPSLPLFSWVQLVTAGELIIASVVIIVIISPSPLLQRLPASAAAALIAGAGASCSSNTTWSIFTQQRRTR